LPLLQKILLVRLRLIKQMPRSYAMSFVGSLTRVGQNTSGISHQTNAARLHSWPVAGTIESCHQSPAASRGVTTSRPRDNELLVSIRAPAQLVRTPKTQPPRPMSGRFDPRSQHAPAGGDETDYVNHVFMNQGACDGEASTALFHIWNVKSTYVIRSRNRHRDIVDISTIEAATLRPLCQRGQCSC
jgi:hypothetical protein